MKKFLCCLVCAAACLDEASAIRVYPFVYSFDPTSDKQSDGDVEKRKEFTYSVTNKLDETIAFEISVFRRYVDKDGKDRLVKDDNSFLIFPSQLIIGPHKERMIKLRWMGNKDFEKNPHEEQAFRVEIKQFHIDLNPFQKKVRKETSSVEFNIQVMTSLYMTPGSSKANPVITKVQVLPNGIALVNVENRGTRRIEYKKIRTEIGLPDYQGPLADVLPENDKEGAIQPGRSHEFIISNTGSSKRNGDSLKSPSKGVKTRQTKTIKHSEKDDARVADLLEKTVEFPREAEVFGHIGTPREERVANVQPVPIEEVTNVERRPEEKRIGSFEDEVFKVKSFAGYQPGQEAEEEVERKAKRKKKSRAWREKLDKKKAEAEKAAKVLKKGKKKNKVSNAAKDVKAKKTKKQKTIRNNKLKKQRLPKKKNAKKATKMLKRNKSNIAAKVTGKQKVTKKE